LKLLVDRCVGLRVTEALRQQGFDALDARDWGDDPGDRQLLERAAAEARILVTLDKDFGALIFSLASPTSGLIRLPNVPVHQRIRMLLDVLREHDAETLTTSIVTIRAGRTRLTRVKRP
jgi:predicted nuclease of predicted toxin-antitoxin system